MPRSCRLERLSSIPTRLGGWHGELSPCLRGGVFQEVSLVSNEDICSWEDAWRVSGGQRNPRQMERFWRRGVATSQIEILGCCNSQLKENKTSLQSVSCWHWRHEAKSPRQLKGRQDSLMGEFVRIYDIYIYTYIHFRTKKVVNFWDDFCGVFFSQQAFLQQLLSMHGRMAQQ